MERVWDMTSHISLYTSVLSYLLRNRKLRHIFPLHFVFLTTQTSWNLSSLLVTCFFYNLFKMLTFKLAVLRYSCYLFLMRPRSVYTSLSVSSSCSHTDHTYITLYFQVVYRT